MDNKLQELLSWEEKIHEEQEQLTAQLEPLLRRREELRVKLELIQRLTGLEQAEVTPNTSSPATPISGNGTVGESLQQAVQEILAETGEPMHISSIRSVLIQRGIPIPGKGTVANVIVHLRRSPAIFAVYGRGTYGLTSWKQRRERQVKA